MTASSCKCVFVNKTSIVAHTKKVDDLSKFYCLPTSHLNEICNLLLTTISNKIICKFMVLLLTFAKHTNFQSKHVIKLCIYVCNMVLFKWGKYVLLNLWHLLNGLLQCTVNQQGSVKVAAWFWVTYRTDEVLKEIGKSLTDKILFFSLLSILNNNFLHTRFSGRSFQQQRN